MSDNTPTPEGGQDAAPDYTFTSEQAIERLGKDKVYAQTVIAAANQTEIGKTYLNNYYETMSAPAIQAAQTASYKQGMGEAYGQLDKLGAEIFGAEKPEGLKTTDWFRQSIQATAPQGNEEAVQIAKDQLDAALAKIKEFESKQQQTAQDHAAKIRELTVGNTVSVGFSSLSFDSQVNEHLLSSVKKTVMAALVQNAKVDDGGNVVFYGNDGKPILNAQQSPATAVEAAKVMLEPMGVLAKPKGGSADPSKIANTNGLSLQGITTKGAALNALSASLTASKVKPNTKQWNDAFNALKSSDKYQALEG